ncbi:Carabin [Labeo rohita]|uniref:Carabin n=1 Tax=Labeo rohita TaxID=84645 RepID=A0ABQ8LDX0_LABRO|nr:Carabin [Labeo rohita]
MLRSASSSSSGKSSASRRSSSVGFDEFGFALGKKRDQKLQHRCHDYSYPQPNPVKVKELCEFLSYWNGSSFICRNQIERFIRIGIPPAIRGRVWRCLLNIDSLRAASSFDYEACQAEIRKPLVDLGVSEYSIIPTIDSLVDTENEINSGQASDLPSADLTLFKQIALDLRRSFPTHRTLMGDRPEAIEGQAKLFRVLTAFARYNPQIGYVQGMSYIAAVLLMILSEEEAFWALVALLEKPKYLSELFDASMKKIQHQALVFHQLLKHRKPLLFQHLETLGVSSLHFIMQWFLTLFTSLPCWDSVLAIWDLIMLHGLQAVFRTGLTIILLLESRIMNMTEEATVLPILLRVPVDIWQSAQSSYTSGNGFTLLAWHDVSADKVKPKCSPLIQSIRVLLGRELSRLRTKPSPRLGGQKGTQRRNKQGNVVDVTACWGFGIHGEAFVCHLSPETVDSVRSS